MLEARGEIIGENKLASLLEKLYSSGRDEDAKLAVRDVNARKQLYKEFCIVCSGRKEQRRNLPHNVEMRRAMKNDSAHFRGVANKFSGFYDKSSECKVVSLAVPHRYI